MAGEADIDRSAPDRPLEGCTVLVTRPRHQAAALAEPLEALGACVLVTPVIDTIAPADWGPADEALARLHTYQWVVLTSVNAVDRLLGRMSELGVPTDALRSLKTAVVGPATAERLAEMGITPTLVPDDHRAEGLVEEFSRLGVGPGTNVLIPRAEKAREILPDSLRASGATVDIVPVYRTVPAAPDPAAVEPLRSGLIDVVTFTSPSTVRHFISWLEGAGLDAQTVMGSIAAASIGPVTSEALVSRGYAPACEAADSTAQGLVTAIGEWCAGVRQSGR